MGLRGRLKWDGGMLADPRAIPEQDKTTTGGYQARRSEHADVHREVEGVSVSGIVGCWPSTSAGLRRTSSGGGLVVAGAAGCTWSPLARTPRWVQPDIATSWARFSDAVMNCRVSPGRFFRLAATRLRSSGP